MQMLKRDFSLFNAKTFIWNFFRGQREKKENNSEVPICRGQPTTRSLREKSVVCLSVFHTLIAGMVTMAMMNFVTRQELEKRINAGALK